MMMMMFSNLIPSNESNQIQSQRNYLRYIFNFTESLAPVTEGERSGHLFCFPHLGLCLYSDFRSIRLGDDQFFSALQEMLPNIPIFHWRENKDKKVAENCWKVPNILNLHYNNKYWQVKESSNGTFYLYAAYYDVREAQIKNRNQFFSFG